MAFSISTELYNFTTINFRTFFCSKYGGEGTHQPSMVPICSHSLLSLNPSPRAAGSLLSLSRDLSILNISHKRNHIICGFLWLASFTEYNVFKIHDVIAWISSTNQYYIPFYEIKITFSCMDVPHLLYLVISWWALGWFPLFGSCE